ncbi:MAG TPA: pyridoxamine 5'-phosphate oxidase family protein [Micromonosporaceae bacterium]|jgi:PPOX class probable F420-dependent enzyme
MSARPAVAMTPDEVHEMLASSRKMQLATINHDGTPHLVAMYYALLEGRIAFWTYPKSQKARNLARDPRLTCLVEEGVEYFDLRGVQVNGTVRSVTDPDGLHVIGRLVAGRLPGIPADAVEEYVAHGARKRWAYVVEPRTVVSWDHRRLR